MNQVFYSGLTAKHALPEGRYRVIVYGQMHPAWSREFSLQIRNGKRPVQELQITGDIMPGRNDSDEEIWRKMTAPATVVDIRNTAHQRVYAEL